MAAVLGVELVMVVAGVVAVVKAQAIAAPVTLVAVVMGLVKKQQGPRVAGDTRATVEPLVLAVAVVACQLALQAACKVAGAGGGLMAPAVANMEVEGVGKEAMAMATMVAEIAAEASRAVGVRVVVAWQVAVIAAVAGVEVVGTPLQVALQVAFLEGAVP
jgi:hypothetical protein